MNLKAIIWARDFNAFTATEHHLVQILASHIKSGEKTVSMSVEKLSKKTCGLSVATVRSALYKLKESGDVVFGTLKQSGMTEFTINYR